MSDAKYLVVRESDQRVIAESYDEQLVVKVAFAMEDRYVESYDIVTCAAEKRYEYLDGRGEVKTSVKKKTDENGTE